MMDLEVFKTEDDETYLKIDNFAILLMSQGQRLERLVKFFKLYDLPTYGWSYKIKGLDCHSLHEVSFDEFHIGDLLVNSKDPRDIRVIVDIYDDYDIQVYSLLEQSIIVDQIDEAERSGYRLMSLDDLVL